MSRTKLGLNFTNESELILSNVFTSLSRAGGLLKLYKPSLRIYNTRLDEIHLHPYPQVIKAVHIIEKERINFSKKK